MGDQHSISTNQTNGFVATDQSQTLEWFLSPALHKTILAVESGRNGVSLSNPTAHCTITFQLTTGNVAIHFCQRWMRYQKLGQWLVLCQSLISLIGWFWPYILDGKGLTVHCHCTVTNEDTIFDPLTKHCILSIKKIFFGPQNNFATCNNN